MLCCMGTKKSNARQTLAMNMRLRRAELEISQEKLAELADLHRTYINSVECGQRNISLDNVERIAKALKMSVADLLEGR
jgi:transcriptional regulator with XRE-family HTH domain